MLEKSSKGHGRDLVALAAVIGATIWGSWLFMRSELDLGGNWTDGEQEYASTQGERIRYAVWDSPEGLAGDVNTLEAEARPALSPDGRWMVFSVGERGLNSDLYIGEWVAGALLDVRPLELLNTGFDELTPAFGPDALYFASDRAGAEFGLDLWRAPYAAGSFGPAEPIGTGINSASDESDPRPMPGTRELLFCSNRPRAGRTDYDMYLASPNTAVEQAPGQTAGMPAPPRYSVAALAALNTPFDEREPTLTSDGRTLIFASDRDGSLGGFDLYRSFKENDIWMSAKPLRGVNSYRSERGPLLSADGFSLFFDQSEAGALPDLFRARSKELFRVPGGPLTIYEIIGLGLLLVLALLAWLSKRWHAVDVIYRCFLASLLVHLFLLWYLREVFPENGAAQASGSEQLFRVHLAVSTDGPPASTQERQGELGLSAPNEEPTTQEPVHKERSAEEAAAAPLASSIARPKQELSAPERRTAELAEHRAQPELSAQLADAPAAVERYTANTPALAVRARSAQAPGPAEASAQPTKSRARSESSTPSAAQPSPSGDTLVAQRSAQDRTPRTPGRERAAQPSRAKGVDATPLAGPSESFQTASAERPELALAELGVAQARARQSLGGAPRPAPGTQAKRAAALANPEPRRQSMARPQLAHPSPSAPLASRFGKSAASPGETLEQTSLLRAVDEPAGPAGSAQASPVFEVGPATATQRPGRLNASGAQPSPLQPSHGASQPAAGLPLPQQAQLAQARPAAPLDDGPRSSALAPSASPIESPERLREVLDGAPPAPRAGRTADHFDATEGLGLARPTRSARRTPRGPQLAAASARGPAPTARPKAQTIVASAPAPVAVRDGVPKRLDHTPYQNRFGKDKLRALDEFGGSLETERAVADGLAYLASIQNSNGSWGQESDYDRRKYRDVRVGKSALALLAFLGAGHTHQSNTEYTPVVRRTVQYLLGIQDQASGHFGDCSSYGHGIATYALAECYALTGDQELRAAIQLALTRILDKQDKRRDERLYGGWGYYFRDNQIWDRDTWPRVSVSSWQVMALKSASIGGFDVPEQAMDAAEGFIKRAWDDSRGAFRYNHNPKWLRSSYAILPASTPASLFALSLLGNDIRGSEFDTAKRFVLERAPERYDYGDSDDFVYRGRGNLYFWYYSTLAIFRVGGDEWARWNASMQPALLGGQERDGSWRPLSNYSEFAGDDDRERTYSTAMCVLTLEIYYRYFTPLLGE